MKLDRVCKVSDVPSDAPRQFETASGEKICIVKAGDRFFACQAYCPHKGVALCDAVFDGDVLTCLEHLWAWNLRNGGEPQGLAEVPLKMYDVEVVEDVVCLRL